MGDSEEALPTEAEEDQHPQMLKCLRTIKPEEDMRSLGLASVWMSLFGFYSHLLT